MSLAAQLIPSTKLVSHFFFFSPSHFSHNLIAQHTSQKEKHAEERIFGFRIVVVLATLSAAPGVGVCPLTEVCGKTLINIPFMTSVLYPR